MKALFVIMLVSALLLFGCAGSQPAPQQNASGMPPAPPNGNATPPAPPAGNETPGNGSNVLPSSPASGITASQLAEHNSSSDCWVAYKGEVYDVTQFLPVHPGGEAKILPFCGTADKFQEAFNMKHGTSKEAILMQQAFVGNYTG